MTTNAIPLDAVRAALTGCAVKAKRDRQGKPTGRVAAFTRYQHFAPCCSRKGVPADTFIHFAVMEHGELSRLVDRVIAEHGADAVRHIWGVGVRALKAEIGAGVLV